MMILSKKSKSSQFIYLIIITISLPLTSAESQQQLKCNCVSATISLTVNINLEGNATVVSQNTGISENDGNTQIRPTPQFLEPTVGIFTTSRPATTTTATERTSTPTPMTMVPTISNFAPDYNIQDEPLRGRCIWKNDCEGNFYLHGDTTTGFYLDDWESLKPGHPGTVRDSYDRIVWKRREPKPSKFWTGSPQTLGYSMPEKGSELFSLLLCWPEFYPENGNNKDPAVVGHEMEFSIKSDPNRRKCEWKWGHPHGDMFEGEQVGEIAGGFPWHFSAMRSRNPKVVDCAMVYSEFQKPPNNEWDGKEGSLGFDMPRRATPHYNMLMCWAYNIRLQSRNRSAV